MVDFSKHLQKAEEAMRRKNFDFAAELYRQLVDLDPDQGEARSGLRHAQKKRVESKKGGKLLRRLGGALPLANAKAMRKLGKHEACARALEDYLASNPVDEEANLLLGFSLEDAGHLESARAVYEFVAEIAPKNPEGLKRAGALMARTGEHGRALEYYERALQADPRDQEALKARKNLAAETALTQTGFESVGHSREKMVDASRALERKPRRHLGEDELREELSKLEERFADAPSDADLMLEMAGLHERLKDLDAALELAERALSYRRDSKPIAARVGELKVKALKRQIAQAGKRGDEAEAERIEAELLEVELEELRRGVQEQPGDAALRLRLGKRLMRAGDLDGALPELQKGQNDPRERQEALFLLGQCFQRKGVLELARKEYEAALSGLPRLDERGKEILYNLGAIAETEGDRAGARSYYLRIYEIDVGYRDVASKVEQLN